MAGCVGSHSLAPLRSFYAAAALGSSEVLLPVLGEGGQSVDVSAVELSLRDLFGGWARDYGLSFIFGRGAADAKCTLHLVGVPVERALVLACRAAGVSVARISGVWVVGDATAKDASFLVRRAGRVPVQSMGEFLKLMLGEGGTFTMLQGVVVCTGSPESLVKLNGLLDDLERLQWGGFVVQVVIVDVAASDAASAGVDLGLNGQVAYKLAYDAGKVSGELSGSGVVDGLVGVARSGGRSKLVSRSSVVVGDGVALVLNNGERLPVVRQSVSDQGTVQGLGVDYVQTGLQVELTPRRVAGGAQVVGHLSVSSVVDVGASGAPRTSERSVNFGVDVRGSSWYLLASLESAQEQFSKGGRTGLSFSRSAGDSALCVFARVYSVGAVVGQGPAAESVDSPASLPGAFPASAPVEGIR